MKVIERKPVPIYEEVCSECGSKIQYKKSEISMGEITCPVCKVSFWANPIKIATYEDTVDKMVLSVPYKAWKSIKRRKEK